MKYCKCVTASMWPSLWYSSKSGLGLGANEGLIFINFLLLYIITSFCLVQNQSNVSWEPLVIMLNYDGELWNYTGKALETQKENIQSHQPDETKRGESVSYPHPSQSTLLHSNSYCTPVQLRQLAPNIGHHPQQSPST